MDADGYPDDDELKTITDWPHENARGWLGLMEYVRPLWRYGDAGYFGAEAGLDLLDRPCSKYHLSTAGWSGNESIIGAMMENTLFWMMCWEQSRRGGHYIFELKESEPPSTGGQR